MIIRVALVLNKAKPNTASMENAPGVYTSRQAACR